MKLGASLETAVSGLNMCESGRKFWYYKKMTKSKCNRQFFYEFYLFMPFFHIDEFYHLICTFLDLKQLFLRMVMEAVRGQKLYCERTLWHSNSMFGSSHSATSWFLVVEYVNSIARDIHIECSKQFKWNSYFYVSGQSRPFWAALKLL